MFTVVFSRIFSRDILLSTRTERFFSVRLAPILVCFDCHFFFEGFEQETFAKIQFLRFPVRGRNKKYHWLFPREETLEFRTCGNQRLIDAFRSMYGIFKKCLRQNWAQHCTSFRAERDKPLTSCLFFYYHLPIEGKMAFFCLLSFCIWWGKPLIRQSPMNALAQTRIKKEERPLRFRPHKHSQSIIIYSHCIAQDHSRTHLKDYFRLMGL